MLGQDTKAEKYRKSGITLSGQDPEARFNSALVLAQLHQDTRALDELERALSRGLPASEVTDNPAWQRFAANPDFVAVMAKAREKNIKNKIKGGCMATEKVIAITGNENHHVHAEDDGNWTMRLSTLARKPDIRLPGLHAGKLLSRFLHRMGPRSKKLLSMFLREEAFPAVPRSPRRRWISPTSTQLWEKRA